MTAIQHSPLSIQHCPQGAGFIDLETAARRSGKSPGHLARLCRDQWAAAGLAELRKTSKAKPAWWIREDADPDLARVKFPEQIGTDLRSFTQKQRDAALIKKSLLDEWESAIQQRGENLTLLAATLQFCQLKTQIDGKAISPRTLQLWYKAYRLEGLAGLIDGRGRESAPWADHPFLEEVKRLYLSLRKPKLSVCVEMARLKAQEQNWPVTSYKTADRFIKQIPAAVLYKYRFGEKAYTDKAEPYLERDYSTLTSNELWNADHHPLDVIVNCGTLQAPDLKRPWLTAFQDCRSRKLVGWLIRLEDPNTDAILLALDRAVRSHGVPQACHVDNGKDFDSWALHGRTKIERRKVRVEIDPAHLGGVFGALNIKASNVWRYHGQSKPIERNFRTVADRFARLWETYCGNTTAEKPEDLAARLHKQQAPLLEEFIKAFDAWLETDYHQRGHLGDSMDRQSPAAVFDANLQRKVTASPELLDLLLKKPTKPVKVGQNGVVWNGLRYGQYAPELIPHLGKQVTLRIDNADLSHVQVFSAQGKFICLAPANGKVPANANSEDLRKAIGQKRAHKKLLANYHTQRPRMADDLPDLMIRAAAARNLKSQISNPQPPADPPSIKPLRSPLEDQLPALQRAMGQRPLKMAVGSELTSDFTPELTQALRRAAQREEDLAHPSESNIDAFAQLGKALSRSDDE